MKCKVTVEWSTERLENRDRTLKEIDLEITILFRDNVQGVFNEEIVPSQRIKSKKKINSWKIGKQIGR
jgi:hypothetical protein